MTLTFGQVIGHLTAGIRKPDGTVDRLEPGAPESEVQGIVTAFSASQYVIEQAALLGANLIITHEGIYYSHQDNREGLENDPVYRQKSELVASTSVGIYRFHDYVHRYTPDGIIEGLLRELEWEPYVERHLPHVSILGPCCGSFRDCRIFEAAAAYPLCPRSRQFIRCMQQSGRAGWLQRRWCSYHSPI